MRDPLAPVVEGVDLSGFVNRFSFQCEPFFTDKGDSATMLDGSTVHDVFPLKARYSWALNSLSARQYAALHAALRDTVSAQIFDPTINAVRVARFHVTRPTFVYNFVTQDYMSTAGSTLILEDTAPRTLSAAPFTRTAATPRDPLAPIIERYDLSGIVNRYSLQCEPFFTDGGNGGTLQDGSTIQDVLATKFRLAWTINAISARQYADLCAVLSAGTVPDTVSASVYNPILSAGYTTTFHVTFPAFRFALDNGQCMAYADSALILTETSAKRGLPVAGDDDWTLFDDGTLSLDPLPDGGDEVDRWRRILDDLDDPPGDPARPILNVDRVQLKPGVPSLPPGVIDQFPNLDDVVIPPDVEIDPDAFDNCPALTVIKIVSFPRKSDYIVGDSLDYAGLSVVEISGGTERDITPDCVLIPAEVYATTEAGDIMVDVRYHDKSLCTFWVQVATVEITEYPAKVSYTVGDTLDYTGLLITKTLPDGTTRDITADCVILPAEGTLITEPGDIMIDVRYDDKSLGIWVAVARSIIESGDWWRLEDDWTLYVYCDGDMPSKGGWQASERWYSEYRKKITAAVISDGVTNIKDFAFNECFALASVTMPDSITRIGEWAFCNCFKLTSITIPDGVTNLKHNTFGLCFSLTSVTIPSSVTFIRYDAFSGCSRLSDVYYSGTEAQWNAITIQSGNDALTSATIHYNSTGST